MPRSRSRSTPGPAERGGSDEAAGTGSGRACRPARWSSPASPPASRPGPSSTSCCPPRSSSSASPRSRRAAGASRRWRRPGSAALAGGGYWYLRNLVHTGNPLPWFDSLGPISLPAPDQALGGREAHSVLGYLSDGSVWSDWFLPGLHARPLASSGRCSSSPPLAGLVLALRAAAATVRCRPSPASPASPPPLAWLVAPTSASGPEGMPQGFESGLRYLAPALVLGLALLPAAPPLRDRPRQLRRGRVAAAGAPPTPEARASPVAARCCGRCWRVAVAAGYVVQREYLRDRYANPTFTAPGLNAAFNWATPLSGARIATTSTRQYPLFGTDLSNRVEFVGEERPHGGFVAPSTCRAWRRLLDAGGYDYVVASRDRIEPGKAPYPPTARWTEGPGATVVLRKPPTVVFRLSGRFPSRAAVKSPADGSEGASRRLRVRQEGDQGGIRPVRARSGPRCRTGPHRR